MKIFFLCFMFSFSTLFAATETREFDIKTIQNVHISNAKGEITASYSKNASKVLLSVDKVQFDPKCKLKVESTLGTLKVNIEHDSGLFEKSNCVAKISVSLPLKAINVEASSSNANITITDLEGKMNVKTATGNVDVKAENLKSFEGKTATGDVKLTFAKCPARADIDLMTASGDAEIHLGSQCKIRVNHKSATGDLFNEIGESEDYQVLISSKSASGDLKIRKLAK